MIHDNPRFAHDCDRCTFLGCFNNEGCDFDLYHCVQGGGIPTVIARYGDDGRNYLSGLGSIIALPSLQEAGRRAKEKNLPITYPCVIQAEEKM